MLLVLFDIDLTYNIVFKDFIWFISTLYYLLTYLYTKFYFDKALFSSYKL